MRKTKNNHYVSQWLIRNFKKDEVLYRLDCKTKKIEIKSEEKLFAKRRLWSEKTEGVVGKEFDTQYAPLIRKIRTFPFESNKKDILVFHRICDKGIAQDLNEFMDKQTMIFKTAVNLVPEADLGMMLSAQEKDIFEVYYGIVNKEISKYTPLLLIDNPVFMDIAIKDAKEMTYELCFMFPISECEILVFAKNLEILTKVFKGYHSIHELNVHMIAQNKAECQIASTNKRYLEMIAGSLEVIKKYRKESKYVIENIR